MNQPNSSRQLNDQERRVIADLLVKRILQQRRTTTTMQPHHFRVHLSGGPALEDDEGSTVKFKKMMDMKIYRAIWSQIDEIVSTSNFLPTLKIMAAVPLKEVKVPAIELYNGKTNPLDYLQHFESLMV